MKNRFRLSWVIIIIFFQIFSSFTFVNNSKISKHLLTSLNSAKSEFLIWIYLTDKGTDTEKNILHPEKYLTKKAIDRREKNHKKFEYNDLPLNCDYLNNLTSSGIKIKNISKWFNCVSCIVTKDKIPELVKKEYVKRLDLVNAFKKRNDDFEFKPIREKPGTPKLIRKNHRFDYGDSFDQAEWINIPEAHDSGYCGQGVIIASFDAGFDNLSHSCFDTLRSKGLITYDFVNHDTIVGNIHSHQGDGAHGTMTLSLVGGFESGHLVSPAFQSKFILAKTENTESETPLEEDNWIAAVEWVDSLGADIITSSLGYLTMDPGPWSSYDWTWMNGERCLVTLGANMATARGIIVVNSAGNEGFDPDHNTLVAPADGFDVISAGAIDLLGERAFFSSVGPTVDNRIKPTVMAVGDGNIVAMPGEGSPGYTSGSGTSFACPMVAGVCAMILSAKPSLNVHDVIDIIKSTADNSGNPDRLVGWGIVDAMYAIDMALGYEPSYKPLPDVFALNQNYPNPFNPVTSISYALQFDNNYVELKVYDISGREVATLFKGYQNKKDFYPPIIFVPNNLASGIYFYYLYVSNSDLGLTKTESRKMAYIK